MTYRYALAALVPDLIRGGVGLAVAVFLLIFTIGSSVLFYIGLGMALLFGAFLANTIRRRFTTVTVDQKGIRAEGPGFMSMGATRIDWGDMQDVAIRYFSTRRDRSNGWMQLTVTGRGRRVRVDSTLDGFGPLAVMATEAARERGLDLDPATVANLETIRGGIRPGAHGS
jgi:uncharacterized membrane protein